MINENITSEQAKNEILNIFNKLKPEYVETYYNNVKLSTVISYFSKFLTEEDKFYLLCEYLSNKVGRSFYNSEKDGLTSIIESIYFSKLDVKKFLTDSKFLKNHKDIYLILFDLYLNYTHYSNPTDVFNFLESEGIKIEKFLLNIKYINIDPSLIMKYFKYLNTIDREISDDDFIQLYSLLHIANKENFLVITSEILSYTPNFIKKFESFTPNDFDKMFDKNSHIKISGFDLYFLNINNKNYSTDEFNDYTLQYLYDVYLNSDDYKNIEYILRYSYSWKYLNYRCLNAVLLKFSNSLSDLGYYAYEVIADIELLPEIYNNPKIKNKYFDKLIDKEYIAPEFWKNIRSDEKIYYIVNSRYDLDEDYVMMHLDVMGTEKKLHYAMKYNKVKTYLKFKGDPIIQLLE